MNNDKTVRVQKSSQSVAQIKCEQCRFWQADELEDEQNNLTGHCRFNPPVIVPVDREDTWWISDWPETLPDDWCGKFFWRK